MVINPQSLAKRHPLVCAMVSQFSIYRLSAIVLSLGSTLAAPGLLSAASVPAPPVSHRSPQSQLLAQASLPDQVLQLVNAERRKVGAVPLRWNSKLTQAAQRQANDMASHNFLSHQGSDGSSPSARINATGYRWSRIAENVAAGQTTAQAVMQSWMNSPGHRTNILNRELTEIGIAYAKNPNSQYKYYWAQVFGRPR